LADRCATSDAALKKHPVIRMPKMRARSTAIYERMHALPSTIVG